MPTRDTITLTGLGFHGYHGVLAEENRLGQRFWIDLDCGVDLDAAARSDDVADTVNYAEMYEVVKTTFESRTFKLIEALAGSIVEALFNRFERIATIRIRIRKPEAPIPMVAGEAAIELYRERS